jgi:hypothetical protein
MALAAEHSTVYWRAGRPALKKYFHPAASDSRTPGTYSL